MTPLRPRDDESTALMAGELVDPHAVLGPHLVDGDGAAGVVIRAFHPDAAEVDYLPARGQPRAMTALGEGLFAVFLEGRKRPPRYRLRFRFDNGGEWERDDPYRFAGSISDDDLAAFADGEHPRLWEMLGAVVRRQGDIDGTRFAVWAPNARAVRVIGDFCAWDGRLLPMRLLGDSGVWELFVPGVGAGARYKFEILTAERQLRVKSDPFGRAMEAPPDAASCVVSGERFAWRDRSWMRRRAGSDLRAAPLSIYEVHLGSWARSSEDPDQFLGYRELAPRLIEHAKRFGFTHLELMPLAEHAFYGSWGYQVTGYYAPTARYGTAADLADFVDQCHAAGVGVLLDWVPVHFPKDDFALRRFDGPALFEVDDPRMGEHPDWGTLLFDVGRPQVRNFLVSNALYWLREFHFDGLRVDAVSWLLRLDYGRGDGEWTPNRDGGAEHLDGIAMLRQLNERVSADVPGAITVAEESASWPGVTDPVEDGGLGFTFKWNMGWMNDTLGYFSVDPKHRRDHQRALTFAMEYEATEHFVNPLSHDEVVHLKKSLLGKMPRDTGQKFANLRLLLAYQFTRPGKKLLFMGTELAPAEEWNHDEGLDWSLSEDPQRRQFAAFMEDLGAFYLSTPSLWRGDPDRAGFAWVDASDHENSVMSFVRFDGEDHIVAVFNLSTTPHAGYRIGVPGRGQYVEQLSTDDPRYGGSAGVTRRVLESEEEGFVGWEQSVVMDLPPLAAVVLAPDGLKSVQAPPAGAVPEG